MLSSHTKITAHSWFVKLQCFSIAYSCASTRRKNMYNMYNDPMNHAVVSQIIKEVWVFIRWMAFSQIAHLVTKLSNWDNCEYQISALWRGVKSSITLIQTSDTWTHCPVSVCVCVCVITSSVLSLCKWPPAEQRVGKIITSSLASDEKHICMDEWILLILTLLEWSWSSGCWCEFENKR